MNTLRPRDWAPEGGQGFHLYRSSCFGKCINVDVAARPDPGRAAGCDIDQTFGSQVERPLCLDELTQIDPKRVPEAVYMLQNGVVRRRQ